MKTHTLILLIALFATGLFSCSDHQLGGPTSPVRLRLRSIQSAAQIAGTTFSYSYTYGYDSLNRPVSINRINNAQTSRAVIDYGGTNATRISYLDYPDPASQQSNSITSYPSNWQGADFTTTKYGLIGTNTNTSVVLRSYQFSFDADKQPSAYTDRGLGIDLSVFGYRSANGNVTSEQYSYSAGHGDFGTATYTYDDKPNPLFGLLDPTVSLIQRFSRNNVLTRTNASGRSNQSGVTSYAYEYNAQQLPTKRTATYGGAVVETLLYTYESY